MPGEESKSLSIQEQQSRSESSAAPFLAGLKLYISQASDIDNAPKLYDGTIADIFDTNGNMYVRPAHIAEKLHPSDVSFRLDAHSPRIKEQLMEMSKLGYTGFDNFSILISGARDIEDLRQVRMTAAEAGLNLGINVKFGLVVDCPSLAMLHNELPKNGPSFVILDLDALSSRMLCRDKRHDSLHQSVLNAIKPVELICKRYGIPIGASGRLLEKHDTVMQLVRHRIDFFVAPSANMERMRKIILHSEKKREIELLKETIRAQIKTRKSF